MEGFIYLHRKLLEWEWYEEHITFKVFVTCLLRASYKDQKYKGIDIKRGEFIIGLTKFSKFLNVSKMQLRTALKKLEKTSCITLKTTHKYTIISICNYDDYQNYEALKKHTKQHNNNTEITLDNNKNKENKKNNKNKNKYSDYLDYDFYISQFTKEEIEYYTLDLLKEWFEYNVDDHKKTGLAILKQINKLKKDAYVYDIEQIRECINNTIICNYRTYYPEKLAKYKIKAKIDDDITDVSTIPEWENQKYWNEVAKLKKEERERNRQ